MNGVQIGLLTFSVMLGMMFFRVPIGVAMLFSGAGAYVYLTGSSFTPLLNFFKNLAYARLSNYDLVVIPPVPFDGSVRHARQPLPGALQVHHLMRRASARRRCDGGDWRLWSIRRDLRQFACHRRDHGAGGAA